MVTLPCRIPDLNVHVLVAAEHPLITRLHPATRLRVILALTSLLVLGLVIVMVVITGARITRRYANSQRSLESGLPDEDDWSHKPLGSPDELAGNIDDE